MQNVGKLTWLFVFAELEDARHAKANLTADKAAWEEAKAQQEAELKKTMDSATKAASAVKAGKKAPRTEKAALASAQSDLAKGKLASLTWTSPVTLTVT